MKRPHPDISIPRPKAVRTIVCTSFPMLLLSLNTLGLDFKEVFHFPSPGFILEGETKRRGVPRFLAVTLLPNCRCPSRAPAMRARSSTWRRPGQARRSPHDLRPRVPRPADGALSARALCEECDSGGRAGRRNFGSHALRAPLGVRAFNRHGCLSSEGGGGVACARARDCRSRSHFRLERGVGAAKRGAAVESMERLYRSVAGRTRTDTWRKRSGGRGELRATVHSAVEHDCRSGEGARIRDEGDRNGVFGGRRPESFCRFRRSFQGHQRIEAR